MIKLKNLMDWFGLMSNIWGDTSTVSNILKIITGLIFLMLLVYIYFYMFKALFSKNGLILLFTFVILCSVTLTIDKTPTFNVNSDELIQELNNSYKSSKYTVSNFESSTCGQSPNGRVLFLLYPEKVEKNNNYTRVDITILRSSDYDTNMAILDDLNMITGKLGEDNLILNDCLSLLSDNKTLEDKTIEKSGYVIQYMYQKELGTELFIITPK